MRTALKFVAAFLLVVIITPVVCTAIVLGSLIFLPLPATLPEAKAAPDAGISHVYDADGNDIATFRQFETNLPVPPEDIPQVLKDAVVSSEDKDFYQHGGVDLPATVRALWADIQNNKVVEGGSTITQQYVKNVFTNGERTIGRKLHEAILANQVDRDLDKDTILYRYLSTIYFGEGAYGVGAAAQTYFRKPVSQLTPSEAALLASIIPAPSQYSPRVNPWIAEVRRVHVLDLMLQQHRITQVGHDWSVAAHVHLDGVGDAPTGAATVVYPPETQQSSRPWFTDYVHSWLEQNLPGCHPHACPMLDQGGLRIMTTLDPKMQDAAEDEVAKAMGNNNPDLDMSIVSVEPPTGYVKAMVGGRDYGYSQYNVATLDPGRQPGSSFKPFVLATAFEEGIQPSKQYAGTTLTLPDGSTIHNDESESYGSIDLRSATWHSVNTVFARLILDVGVDKAMTMAQRLGVDMPAYDPSKYGASVALGAIEAKPLQMASAYAVFANHGKRAAPIPVLQVFGPDGKLIIDNTNTAATAQPVISDVIADNVTDVLRGVLVSGTAAGKGIDRPAAGKTGTTEDNANAWFVGYTPTLSTAVWMGHLGCGVGPKCALRNINGVGAVFGGTIPASTWQKYMKRALVGVQPTDFTQPAPIQTFADAVKRVARQGFDPGPRKYPTKASAGGPYVDGVSSPSVDAPVEPTTSTSSTSSTTTTTQPTVTTPTTRPRRNGGGPSG